MQKPMTHRLTICGADNEPCKLRTLADIEAALDNGQLYALMNNGRFWQMRRNGRTQTWKRDPRRFRIPFKVGFRGTGALTEANMCDYGLDRTYFRPV